MTFYYCLFPGEKNVISASIAADHFDYFTSLKAEI
jgi:hypothetical protein